VFDEGLEGKIAVPTLHVVGKKDFVYKHSMRLYNLCNANNSALLLHEKGHEIPADGKMLSKLAVAIKELSNKAMFY